MGWPQTTSTTQSLLGLMTILVALARQCSGGTSGKVVDFGDKLPDYIRENPNKGWLIKFYTPWCYNCQQIELTYIEVAEKIYHAHDQLIVGQVNCDKYDTICRQFEVTGVPTIAHIRGSRQLKYNGRREVASIVSFAERMNGPDVNLMTDCNQIIPELDRRGLIVVHSAGSGDKRLDTTISKAFNEVAAELKRDHWFYRLFNKTCGSSKHSGEGVYILKKNLSRWIKFNESAVEGISRKVDAALRDFIASESFPVFGPLSSQLMNTTRLLAVAVLEEYAPAKKLDLLSKKFYKEFEQVAIKEAQRDDQILFAWSTDLHTIRKIALSSVRTPNVILLKPDLSHNLMLKLNDDDGGGGCSSCGEADNDAKKSDKLPEVLSQVAVAQFLQAARDGSLEFTGGDSYLQRVARYIYSYIIMVIDRYEANPVLTSLMLLSLATTTMILLYKTRTYLREDEENLLANQRPQQRRTTRQANHRKQD